MDKETVKIKWKQRERQKRRARETAEEIIDELRFTEPPIDPLEIAELEVPFLKVVGHEFGDLFDGQLEYHASYNRFLLFYNSKYETHSSTSPSHGRTRFSIAHELGHYFIDDHREYLLEGGGAHQSHSEFLTDNIVEIEADSFAAGLLTPTKMLSCLANKSQLTLTRIEELARIFNVSVLSMAISCVQLSHFPCAVVALVDGKIRWKCTSEPLFEAGCYPNYNALPESARLAWKDFVTGNRLSRKADTSVDLWFQTFGRHAVYFEESYFPIPIMGTLVILLTADERDFS